VAGRNSLSSATAILDRILHRSTIMNISLQQLLRPTFAFAQLQKTALFAWNPLFPVEVRKHLR
jgi:hypothetical protein